MRRVILIYPGDNFAKRDAGNSLVTGRKRRCHAYRIPAVPVTTRVPCSHEVGMTDSPRRDAPDPTQPLPYGYPGYTDPAYANQPPHGTYYQPPPSREPTQQLPPYSPYALPGTPTHRKSVRPAVPTGRHAARATRPERPRTRGCGCGRSRRWSVLVVLGLVIALVIVNSSQQQTVVAPPHRADRTDFTTAHRPPRRAPTTTRPATPCADPATNDAARRIDDTGRDGDGRLRRHRDGPRHQHHLRRQRRRAADRVQRHAAVEQGGPADQARRPLGERQHHQRRP